MSARRLLSIWRRARRAGTDLDAVSYLAAVVAGVVFLATMTGALGPTLDAEVIHTPAAQHHAAR
jgi:hypothetical protein